MLSEFGRMPRSTLVSWHLLEWLRRAIRQDLTRHEEARLALGKPLSIEERSLLLTKMAELSVEMEDHLRGLLAETDSNNGEETDMLRAMRNVHNLK